MRRRAKGTENLVGIKFNCGEVQSLIGKDGKGHRIWNVKCECGNYYNAITESLKSGNTKSCGCLNLRKGSNHPNYRGFQDLSGDYWAKLKKGSQNRGIDFELSIEDAWKLFIIQNKKCALTGWDISLTGSLKQWKKEQTASLDRIENNQGYILNNVQWVHKDINRLKNNYTQSYFIQMCRAITENNLGDIYEIRPCGIQGK